MAGAAWSYQPSAQRDHPRSQPGDGAIPSRKTGRYGTVAPTAPDTPPGLPGGFVDPGLPRPTTEVPGKGVRVARRRRLLRIASEQHGLFTSEQAGAAGYDRRARHHHLSYGNWRRTEAPRVFALTGWPTEPTERLRAWWLWAGPGAHLTSWSALGLAGLTPTGPRVPICIELAPTRGRTERRRRSRRHEELQRAGMVGAVHLHPAVPGSTRSIDGFLTRPPEEAIVAAICRQPHGIALGLTSALLDAGHLDLDELVGVSRWIRCPPLSTLLLQHLRR